VPSGDAYVPIQQQQRIVLHPGRDLDLAGDGIALRLRGGRQIAQRQEVSLRKCRRISSGQSLLRFPLLRRGPKRPRPACLCGPMGGRRSPPAGRSLRSLIRT
jgi:hypothetical protein